MIVGSNLLILSFLQSKFVLEHIWKQGFDRNNNREIDFSLRTARKCSYLVVLSNNDQVI